MSQPPDLHMTDFYNDTGRILVSLYRSFPREETLWVDDICGPTQLDEFGQHSIRHQACMATVLWLRREGYLTFTTQDGQAGFDHCVLTEKALALLAGWHQTATADGVRPIDALDNALANRSSQAMEMAVQSILKTSACGT